MAKNNKHTNISSNDLLTDIQHNNNNQGMQNKLKPRQSEHYKKNTDMQVGRHLK
jgi:hypothetical protein